MVYTAPNFSFIDAFTNNAKDLDERTKRKTDDIMNGMAGLVKGGGEAWKWQQRKNAADEFENMQKELAKLQAERDQLLSEKQSLTPSMDAIMQKTGWAGVPYPYQPQQQQAAQAPVGLGVFKKELL